MGSDHSLPDSIEHRRSADAPVAERLLSAGLVLACVAVAAQTVAHIVNAAVFDSDLERFDAGGEGTAWTWASTVATFAAAFAALIHAALGEAWRRRSVVLAALLAFFSLDDVIQLHEYAGTAAAGLSGPTDLELHRVIWPSLFLPLLVVAAVLLVQLTREAGAREQAFVRVGLVLLAVALALEVASVAIRLRWAHEWPDELEIVLEEGAELGGWMLIATALTATTVRALTAFPRR